MTGERIISAGKCPGYVINKIGKEGALVRYKRGECFPDNSSVSILNRKADVH